LPVNWLVADQVNWLVADQIVAAIFQSAKISALETG
jgi:hypothetical protein